MGLLHEIFYKNFSKVQKGKFDRKRGAAENFQISLGWTPLSTHLRVLMILTDYGSKEAKTIVGEAPVGIFRTLRYVLKELCQ